MLNHTDEAAEGRLREDLAGLDWLPAKVSGQPARERPIPQKMRAPAHR